METAQFDVNDFSKPRAGDEKLAVRFFVKAKQDSVASQEAGRPIFKEHEYIQIMVPGDRNQIIMRPVTEYDSKQRFSQQYDHWKKTQTNEAVIGTPLEAWGILNLAQVEEYRYFGVRTIEQMAELRDDIVGKIMGAVTLKQRALVFLQLAKADAPMKHVQAVLDQKDNEIETLRKAIADQAAILHEWGRKLGLPVTPLEAPAPVAPKAKKAKAPGKPKMVAV